MLGSDAIHSKKVLETWANMYVEELKKEITSKNHIASGNMLKSIKASRVKETDKGLSFDIEGSKYVLDLSFGYGPSKGNETSSRVRQSNLIQWMKKKGITPYKIVGSRKVFSTSESAYKKATYKIGLKLSQFGYKGSGMIERFQQRLYDDYTQELIDALKIDITEHLNTILQANNRTT